MTTDSSADDFLATARREAEVAVRLFGAPRPQTFAELERMMAWLQLTPLPRDSDRTAFADDAWLDPEGLRRLITLGRRLDDLRRRAAEVFTAEGLTADYTAIRANLTARGGGLFRFLDSGYRTSMARLKSYARVVLPREPEACLKQIDLVLRLRKAETDVHTRQALGRAFGATWRGPDSDWERLEHILKWRLSHGSLPPGVWRRLAALSDADLTEADRARQALYAALTGYRRSTSLT